MNSKLLGWLFVIVVSYVGAQRIVNRVYLLNHGGYMINTIQQTMNTIEDRGWSNLKLHDIEYDYEETVFNKNYTGSVTYKNGFLVSIQHLDVLNASLSQIWNVTTSAGVAKVNVRGQLRMTDVTLGYDVEADLEDGKHYYTGTITHPLVVFDFWVVKVLLTHETWTTTYGQISSVGNIINLLPHDPTSDALTSLFYVRDTEEGVKSWAAVFHPIFDDIVKNRVPFPDMCYNCPVQV